MFKIVEDRKKSGVSCRQEDAGAEGVALIDQGHGGITRVVGEGLPTRAIETARLLFELWTVTYSWLNQRRKLIDFRTRESTILSSQKALL
ncbi:hypothetical protein [Mesorhizobium sp. M0633]|uniref:hypothetical protein n=1 Tax=Mesorhizobium sp. M0633 TaxID=2956977 RepID=UPI0033390786